MADPLRPPNLNVKAERGGGGWSESSNRTPTDTAAEGFFSHLQFRRRPMPRPRTPAAKAEVAGSNVIHPERFRDRKPPKRTKPIGPPYAGMTAPQVAVWNESVGNMPWLHAGHRLLLRQVCVLAARMETDPDMGVSALQALGAALSKLGATPTDETKVSHDDGETEDPADEFFSRPN